MKIGEALKEAYARGEKLHCRSLGMWNQTPTSILYWLAIDPETTEGKKIDYLNDMLTATDWEVNEV